MSKKKKKKLKKLLDKMVKAAIREQQVKDGFFDGRFRQKLIQNKKKKLKNKGFDGE